MKRIVNIDEITDDRLYKASDLIRIGCDGCSGRATCCRDTEDTIILDPYDLYELEKVTGLDFAGLYGKYIALRVVDGVILPYLAKSELTGSCVFLGDDGRCTIHNNRPGFCRLFPLGRLYHDNGFSYFMQEGQCSCDRKPKTEIAKWLEIPNLRQYEEFILDWNRILEKHQNEALKLYKVTPQSPEITAQINKLSMELLNKYYLPKFNTELSFYEQFCSIK